MYKLNDMSRQELSQLAHQQRATLLGHDSYRRFGARLPLHVRIGHSVNAQALMPGQGVFCYLHHPLVGSGLLVVQASVLPPANMEPTTAALTTAVYDVSDPMTIDYSGLDAFVLLAGLEGACELTANSGATLPFCEGETVLIPAATRTVRVEGTIKFLEIYI